MKEATVGIRSPPASARPEGCFRQALPLFDRRWHPRRPYCKGFPWASRPQSLPRSSRCAEVQLCWRRSRYLPSSSLALAWVAASAAVSSCRPPGRPSQLTRSFTVARHRAKALAARHRAFIPRRPSRPAPSRPACARHTRTGTPVPARVGRSPFSTKENAMFAALAVRESHRIPVLLGGSGLTSPAPLPQRKLAVLLRPLPCLGKCMGRPCADCRVAA